MVRALDRVYHHVDALEETRAGMWRTAAGDEAKGYLQKSRELMIDYGAFRAAMLRAIEEWPVSCEHNLSAVTMNRLAWLGHAGNCIAHGSPESITRLAWHTLNSEQQDIANQVAAEVVEIWEQKYAEKRRAHSCQKSLLDMMF